MQPTVSYDFGQTSPKPIVGERRRLANWVGKTRQKSLLSRPSLYRQRIFISTSGHVHHGFDHEDHALLLEGLRKAGLPDEPSLSLPDKPSIAVLPFQNMSGDPEQEYFADGIVEDIITASFALQAALRHRAQFELHLQGPRR